MSLISELINNYRRFTQRKRLIAVQDDDLELVLSGLGILEPLKTGDIKCIHCGDPVQLGNLAGWTKKQGKPFVFCDKPECLISATNRKSEARIGDG